MHLKMSFAEVVCCKKMPNITDKLSTEAVGRQMAIKNSVSNDI